MNRLAVITGFLGAARNRYMDYQPDRTIEEKLRLAERIDGLDGLELCYPGDFEDYGALKAALASAGMSVSAVNFRSRRTGRWLRGSFSSNDAREREEVVEDCRRAMDYARDLGCNRVTTCPLNDGYDYPFELDYATAHGLAQESFTRCCEHDPQVQVHIEYKPNDPRVRCLFATAGETLSFCQASGVSNLGVTMDTGHALAAGERPAQAACMVASLGRPLYIHINDNDRSWDWDMIPGAYHLWEFVELFYHLRRIGYDDDWYAFDVFPKEIDVAKTFSVAFDATRKLEAVAARVDEAEIQRLLKERDPAATMCYLWSLL